MTLMYTNNRKNYDQNKKSGAIEPIAPLCKSFEEVYYTVPNFFDLYSALRTSFLLCTEGLVKFFLFLSSLMILVEFTFLLYLFNALSIDSSSFTLIISITNGFIFFAAQKY